MPLLMEVFLNTLITAVWGNGSKIDGNLIARKVGRNLDISDVLRSGFS